MAPSLPSPAFTAPTMRLLQIILALFSATVWAQTNSTGPTHSNSTGTPYPGVLNSPNLTVIYPKSGDYCK